MTAVSFYYFKLNKTSGFATTCYFLFLLMTFTYATSSSNKDCITKIVQPAAAGLTVALIVPRTLTMNCIIQSFSLFLSNLAEHFLSVL